MYRHFIILMLIFGTVMSASRRTDRVYLEDVRGLTLHKSGRTLYRRGEQMPQIECVGGSAECEFEPSVIRCIQKKIIHKDKEHHAPISQINPVGGSADCEIEPLSLQCIRRKGFGDIQWHCKADLPEKYKFGRTDVFCEGYDFPEDPFILRDSCYVRYTLDWADEEKHYWTIWLKGLPHEIQSKIMGDDKN